MEEKVLQHFGTKDYINMMNEPAVSEKQISTKKLVKNNTGMIMDNVSLSEEAEKANENMQAAVENNQIAKLRAMMAKPKQKVREYNISRNDKCPCGSGKKYKNCCLSTGQYEKLIDKK